MNEYKIAVCEIRDIADGMLVEPIYYKVFSVDSSGSWWFESEFETLECAEAYINLSHRYPEKGVLEKAIMAEKGEE